MARNEKMNGIKIDFVSGIIYISNSFNERANNPTSDEYRLLKEVLTNEIIIKSSLVNSST